MIRLKHTKIYYLKIESMATLIFQSTFSQSDWIWFLEQNLNFKSKFISFNYNLWHQLQNKLQYCCDMSQNDTIGKIELNPSFVLSSDNTNCKNDIQ